MVWAEPASAVGKGGSDRWAVPKSGPPTGQASRRACIDVEDRGFGFVLLAALSRVGFRDDAARAVFYGDLGGVGGLAGANRIRGWFVVGGLAFEDLESGNDLVIDFYQIVEDAEGALGKLEREISERRLDLDKLQVRVVVLGKGDLDVREEVDLGKLPSTVDELEEERTLLKKRVDDLRTASWNR